MKYRVNIADPDKKFTKTNSAFHSYMLSAYCLYENEICWPAESKKNIVQPLEYFT